MKEHFNRPEEEMLAAYGDVQPLVEPFSADFDGSESEIGTSLEDLSKEVAAEQYLAQHSPEELRSAEAIFTSVATVYEKVDSDSILVREKAAIALLGSAFAAAPLSIGEQGDLPLWKRMVSGASLGAQTSRDAVLLAEDAAASSDDEGFRHKSQRIGNLVQDVFGASPIERSAERRNDYKYEYSRLEKNKKELLGQLHELTQGVVELDENSVQAQRLMEDRDAKLAALSVERTLEQLAYQNKEVTTIEDEQRIEASLASIASRESAVREEYMRKLLESERMSADRESIIYLRDAISRIEATQQQITDRLTRMFGTAA